MNVVSPSTARSNENERTNSLPARKPRLSINAALREAYRVHGSDKFTRLAAKRYLR